MKRTGSSAFARPRSSSRLFAAGFFHSLVGQSQGVGNAHGVDAAAVGEPVPVAFFEIGDVLVGSQELDHAFVDGCLGEGSMVHGGVARVAMAVFQPPSLDL